MSQKLTNISNIIAYLRELNLLQIEGRDKRGVSFDLREHVAEKQHRPGTQDMWTWGCIDNYFMRIISSLATGLGLSVHTHW